LLDVITEPFSFISQFETEVAGFGSTNAAFALHVFPRAAALAQPSESPSLVSLDRAERFDSGTLLKIGVRFWCESNIFCCAPQRYAVFVLRIARSIADFGLFSSCKWTASGLVHTAACSGYPLRYSSAAWLCKRKLCDIVVRDVRKCLRCR
jgi:hypothetical protein